MSKDGIKYIQKLEEENRRYREALELLEVKYSDENISNKEFHVFVREMLDEIKALLTQKLDERG